MGGGVGPGTRSGMRYLQSLIRIGQQFADEDIQKMCDLVDGVMADPRSSARDKLRANELRLALMDSARAAANEIAKYERIDSGQATDLIKEVGGDVWRSV